MTATLPPLPGYKVGARLALVVCLATGAGLFAPAGGAAPGNGQPPEGARLLFNGKDLTGWVQRNGKPANWKVEHGTFEVVPGNGDIMTKEMFGPDFQLHTEFWIPLMADKKGQDRGNSGIYLQGRYEVQILDSWRNETYPDGACGALYKLIPPRVNACKPPEQWQTYDITFHAPDIDKKGNVTGPGWLTVVLNGATVIEKGKFGHETGAAAQERIASPGPIRLQDHGARVRFRNIWLKPLAGSAK